MTVAGEAPKPLRVIDGSVGDTAGVLARVDETKIVASWLAFL